jgi:diaminopimelate epimerase
MRQHANILSDAIEFTKMQGAGNDYIYVNTFIYNIEDPAEVARRWSAPHTGIGSDGLVLIGPSPVAEADFSMRIFNADGSEAMMCGNASRCIGKYVYEKGLTTKTTVRLHTLSGIKELVLNVCDGKVETVTVDMGEPMLQNAAQYDVTALTQRELGTLPKGVFVSMGNPHYVIFTDDVDSVATKGPLLEKHPAFPQRCNIEFAHLQGDGTIRMRVWERGSGITMACGTGACATAVAAMHYGYTSRKTAVVMDGGALTIEWSSTDNHVYMTGPAAFVFEGRTPPPSRCDTPSIVFTPPSVPPFVGGQKPERRGINTNSGLSSEL